MKDQAKQTVSDFLMAVQQGDLEKLAMLIHPEVIWEQPGNSRISGTKHSSAEVFQMVGSMFALSGNTLTLSDIGPITVHGNHVACQLHWTASQVSGKELDVTNIDIYRVEEGKITGVKIYTADQQQEDLFWGM
jgi:ketosteroid isomerase-like protein